MPKTFMRGRLGLEFEREHRAKNKPSVVGGPLPALSADKGSADPVWWFGQRMRVEAGLGPQEHDRLP